ncbi:MAG TPA: hypothetical protein VI337_02215, partial [Nitrospirales bacterium]|nr:hypothetical protein [Nitrospirales bacterium]
MPTSLHRLIPAGLALVLAGCVSISLFPQVQPLQEKTVQGTAADKILMIDVSGVITEGTAGGFSSVKED